MESDPSPDPSIMGQFILIAILTLINAFFSLAEIALVSVNKNKIKLMAEQGNKKAQLLEKFIKEPTKALSTIQVGITLAAFLSSASASTGIANKFTKFLTNIGVPYSSEVSIVIITIVLSYVTLVFGELLPKRIALQKPDAFAMRSIGVIVFLSKITSPFVKLLSGSINILVKVFGLDKKNTEETISKEEIKSLVEVGREYGVINETEKQMINGIFEFDDKLAKEVMTPRPDVFLINVNTSHDEIMDELMEEKYSRIPVYEDDIDNIIGILYMKDLFIEIHKNHNKNIDIRKMLHTPYFVLESKNIDELFKELQTTRNHMAVLIDEYGGFSGIATIEDLIEEVMGEIDDEYDDSEPDIKKVDNDTFVVSGSISVDNFNNYLNLNLISEYSDTIGGFVVDLLGHIPHNGERKAVNYENIIFKIEEVKDRRIEKVKVCMAKEV
ncbi:hemolysin family protein [Clostridium drakei]|uniref:Hemolysin n=1 Tax=Clostridium drakei TaxID=332101 RepID=A0A2U8DSI0_9CLOT|nr:hemolysin family protein [Clostridium drakei]AWI05580.1 hemolysin [Clostridium drakei]